MNKDQTMDLEDRRKARECGEVECPRCHEIVAIDIDGCRDPECPVMYGEARIAEGHPWQPFFDDLWRIGK